MNNAQVNQENPLQQRMAEEEKIREKVDDDGTRWTKVYFGGGAHFRNWLSQFVELRGEENVQVEEADSTGFQCYQESGEKMYRIWVKEADLEDKVREIEDKIADLKARWPAHSVPPSMWQQLEELEEELEEAKKGQD
jgi:DNA repair exonuclease SbcCD ATPase subunit